MLLILVVTMGAPDGVECALEKQFCQCGSGQIWYGAQSSWIVKYVTGGAWCTNAVFSDPLDGVAKKCFCTAQPSQSPSTSPTKFPTSTTSPTVSPSLLPTVSTLSMMPSILPSTSPTVSPTMASTGDDATLGAALLDKDLIIYYLISGTVLLTLCCCVITCCAGYLYTYKTRRSKSIQMAELVPGEEFISHVPSLEGRPLPLHQERTQQRKDAYFSSVQPSPC